MAYVELQDLRREFGEVVALDGIDLSPRGGRVPLAARALRVRQDDRAAARRRLRPARLRPHPRRRQGHDARAAEQARHGHGLPGVLALPEHDRRAERRVRAQDPRRRARRSGAGKVAELLELVGLGHAGKRYPHQLSGGMQQRVALARALAIEPRVLLLDEPLSALDAKVRVQLREEIRRIQSRLGITTIYVTHDQEEALSISDRVAVLSQGRIEQIGPPGEIYDAPATPFVAEFVGTMNRLEGTVEERRRRRLRREAALDRRRARARRRRARARARAPGDGRAPAARTATARARSPARSSRTRSSARSCG